MALVTLKSGKSFQSPSGMSILDAASLKKIAIPHSCKTGRCGACKCKVLSGSTHALKAEVGLTDKEKAEGWILSCVRSIEIDSLLEVDDLGDIDLPIPKTLPCRISALELIAPDVVQVFLRLPPNTDFRFIPGQYIDVIGPKGTRRSYSIANASFAKKVVELQIRQVRGGAMSEYWFKHAKPNDLLRLNGPHGSFFLRETVGIDLIFLATGTGISPVKAILESINNLEPGLRPNSVTVLWGGRYTQDLYLDVGDMFKAHTYMPVISRAPDCWTGAKGYVQDVLLAMKPDLSTAAVYAGGSDSMIRSAKSCLVEAGLSEKRFYSDAFVSSGTD